jgi:hypothetical protein
MFVEPVHPISLRRSQPESCLLKRNIFFFENVSFVVLGVEAIMQIKLGFGGKKEKRKKCTERWDS